MQQFIAFEDEWDMLEKLGPEALIPYHVGVPCRHDLAAPVQPANDACLDGHSSVSERSKP